MVAVTAIRAVNVPVEDRTDCAAFYRDRLGMSLSPDVLPGGTMCRWTRETDQFIGIRPRETGERRWRYPYGRCVDWDHVEIHLDGPTDDLSPVETHPDALVLADPEDRAIEALLTAPGPVVGPTLSEVGVSVAAMDAVREYYDRLGFEPVGADADDRAVFLAESGQRWVLVPEERPGLHHVTFALAPSRYRAVTDRLSGYPHREGTDRVIVADPEGRRIVLREDDGAGQE